MTIWLTLQLLIALAWALASWLLRAPVARGSALRLARAAVLVALLAPLAVSLVPEGAVWRPAPQVWTAETVEGTAVALSGVQTPAFVASQTVARAGTGLAVGLLLLAGLWALGAMLRLRLVLRETQPLRRIGGLELRLGSRTFAAWRPGRAYVVLHRDLRGGPDWRLALLHELQHHRQGDTRFAWLLLGLRVLCAPNPFVHLLSRQLAALEELACDAALIARDDVPAHSYGSCLLRAASSPRTPALGAGLHHPTLLSRRIQMLCSPPAVRRLSVPLSLAMLLLFVGTAWAASGLVETRSFDEVEVLHAAAAASSADFDVPENAVIAEALNKLLGSPKGRAFVRDSLVNRADYASLVDGALVEYDLPAQLAAVPLIESGYVNLGLGQKGASFAPGVPGKGIWMFIAPTARSYELIVTDERDDRLDPTLETDAAMRLLSHLHEVFGDWGLALAGYNQGERHVRRAIQAEGTRDPWVLSERGAINDYAPMVMAAAMILADPSLAAAR